MIKVEFMIILLISQLCLAQPIFKNKKIGFEIKQPKNWIVAKNEEIIENIKDEIKIDPKNLQILLEKNKASLNLVTFYKYPLEKKPGVIPTIKVMLKQKHFDDFDDFAQNHQMALDQMKAFFADFKFLTQAYKTKISGFEAVKSCSSYTLESKKNGQEKVILTVYSVFVKPYSYQITCIDSETENNSELFDKVAQSIVIY